jgi:hypothetical protein
MTSVIEAGCSPVVASDASMTAAETHSPCRGAIDAAVCDVAGVIYQRSQGGVISAQTQCTDADLCRADLPLERVRRTGLGIVILLAQTTNRCSA